MDNFWNDTAYIVLGVLIIPFTMIALAVATKIAEKIRGL